MNISTHQIKYINYCLSEGYFDSQSRYTVKFMVKFFLSEKTFREFISSDEPLIVYTGEVQKVTGQKFVRFTKRGKRLIAAGNWYRFVDDEKRRAHKIAIASHAAEDHLWGIINRSGEV